MAIMYDMIPILQLTSIRYMGQVALNFISYLNEK